MAVLLQINCVELQIMGFAQRLSKRSTIVRHPMLSLAVKV